MNPYIDQSTPRRTSRNPLHGLTPEEAAGLIALGIVACMIALVARLIGWWVG